MPVMLLLLLLMISSSQAASINCTDLLEFRSSVSGFVTDVKEVRTDRDLLTYLARLPTEFSNDLVELGENDHWVDMGAGDGKAVSEYLTDLAQAGYVPHWYSKDETRILGVLSELSHKTVSSRAKVTAITYKTKNTPDPFSQVRFLTGRMFEEVSNQEIGKANVITDVMGVFAYSVHKDEVLAKYLDLLTENGSIYIDFGNDYFDPGLLQSKVVKKDGTVVSLLDWISSIPGLDVQTYKMPFFARPWGYERPIVIDEIGIRIRKVSSLKIPKLKFEHGDVRSLPPSIQYRE